MKTKMILAAGVLGLMGVFTTGCGNPCSDLDAICEVCSDDDAQEIGRKAACDFVVAADDSDACQNALDTNAFDICED